MIYACASSYLSGRASGYQKHLTSESDFVRDADARIEQQQRNNKQYQRAKQRKEEKKKGKIEEAIQGEKCNMIMCVSHT